jgi:hypothetical protein
MYKPYERGFIAEERGFIAGTIDAICDISNHNSLVQYIEDEKLYNETPYESIPLLADATVLVNPDTREEKLAKVLNGIAVLAHITYSWDGRTDNLPECNGFPNH